MNQVGKVSIRPMSELMGKNETVEVLVTEPDIIENPETPEKIKRKKAATTSKKKKTHNTVATGAATGIVTTDVKKSRSSRKDPLPGQLRIDSFWSSATKNYKIEPKKEESIVTGSTCKKGRGSAKKPKRRRKALFKDDESSTSVSDDKNWVLSSRKTRVKADCIIDLCDDSGAEEENAATDTLKHSEITKESNKRKSSDSKSEELPTPQAEKTIATVEATYENALHVIEEVYTPQKADNSSKGSRPLVHASNEAQDLTPTESNQKLSKPKSFNKEGKTSVEKPSDDSSITPTATSNSYEAFCDDNWDRKITLNTARTLRTPAKNPEKGYQNVNALEQTASRTKRNTKKQISTPPSENTCLKQPKPRKGAIRKDSVLSPSDTNTSRLTRSATKRSPAFSTDTSSSKKQIRLEAPTPSESVEHSSSVADVKPNALNAKDERVQLSFSADVIAISDEEQENLQIEQPPSTKRRSKRTVKTKKTESKRQPRPCPPYKVVEGTSFAVDAFRYGDIEGVTHYFLTHFHADHYIGLNRKFSHPLYLSPITARLLRVFIPIDEKYINELELNASIIIDDVEVTAIDANHCPGAIMLIFKTRQGRCILHTGDFRASPGMESEPIFWNNDIHTIYLDTTYLSNKYAFCAQTDSVDRGLHIVKEFHEKNVGTRILYVCGSYLIGKERFWSTIAHKLSMKVWTDVGRRKALDAIQDENLLSLLVDDPHAAHLHVIPMVHLSYFTLVDYIDKYSDHFDVLFALRPSGWEKDSKPQFRGKVNIVGIEYSEHSSHDEMKRFVQYLKPQTVISTVPVSRDPMKTPKIPDSWYKYECLTGQQRQFQPSITNFFKLQNGQANKPQKSVPRSVSNAQENEMIISPLEKSDNAVADDDENDEKMEERGLICYAEEEDDWLT